MAQSSRSLIIIDDLPGREPRERKWKKAFNDLPQLINKEDVREVYDELDRADGLLLKREKSYESERRDQQRSISRLLEDVRQVMALLPKNDIKARLGLALERYIASVKPGGNIRNSGNHR